MLNRREFFNVSFSSFLLPFFPFRLATEKKSIILLEDYVAGFQYYSGEKIVNALKKGTLLYLKREPSNIYDELAIEVFVPSGIKLGYIPRSINPIPARLIEQRDRLSAKVVEIKPHPAPPWERVRIRVEMSL